MSDDTAKPEPDESKDKKAGPPPIVKIRPVHEARVKLNRGGQANNEYFVTAEEGTPPEAVFEPAYWAHVAEKFRPYDVVVIGVDDEAWYMQAIVRAVLPQSVYLSLLPGFPMTLDGPDDQTFIDQYEVKWRGPHDKWCVMRLSDNLPVAKELPSRDAANRWLQMNAKTLMN